MRYILASVYYSLYVYIYIFRFYVHILLTFVSKALKGVSSDLDAAVELLESIEHFLKRLDIYTKVPPTEAMSEIVVKILVELLSTLALATKQIRQGRSSESVFTEFYLTQCNAEKFVKKLFGENGIGAVLQRLDRLTQDEARTTAAQTLEVVYRLSQNMRTVVDGKKKHVICQSLVVEHRSL